MEDQRIMFIMGPVHTWDNDQGASGTGVRNRPLSRKGLICMPRKDGIWTGVPVHPTETPGGTHRTIIKTYILMSTFLPVSV